MARDVRQDPTRRGLSVSETLAALAKIDRAVLAFCVTAPDVVLALGGGTVPEARAWVQGRCQMTCVGPVPRLSEEAWEACAYEHAERQREELKNTWRGAAAARGRPGPGGDIPPSPDRARRLVLQR